MGRFTGCCCLPGPAPQSAPVCRPEWTEPGIRQSLAAGPVTHGLPSRAGPGRRHMAVTHSALGSQGSIASGGGGGGGPALPGRSACQPERHACVVRDTLHRSPQNGQLRPICPLTSTQRGEAHHCGSLSQQLCLSLHNLLSDLCQPRSATGPFSGSQA